MTLIKEATTQKQQVQEKKVQELRTQNLRDQEHKALDLKLQEQKARAAFIANYEERGRKYGAKIDVMIAKTGEKKAEAKASHQKRIDEMKAKLKTAKQKLDEMRASGDGKWHHFKADLAMVWADVEHTFKGLPR